MFNFQELKVPEPLRENADIQRLTPYAMMKLRGQGIDYNGDQHPDTHLISILGLDRAALESADDDAAKEMVRRAYRPLSRLLHPDTQPALSVQYFQIVNEANGVLSDNDKRAIYFKFIDPAAGYWREGQFSEFYRDAIDYKQEHGKMPWEEAVRTSRTGGGASREQFDPRQELRRGHVPDHVPDEKEKLQELALAAGSYIQGIRDFPDAALGFLEDLAAKHQRLYAMTTELRGVRRVGLELLNANLESPAASVHISVVYNLPRAACEKVVSKTAGRAAALIASGNARDIDDGLQIVSEFNGARYALRGFPALRHLTPLHRTVPVRRAALDLGRGLLQQRVGTPGGFDPDADLRQAVIAICHFRKGANATFWNDIVFDEARRVVRTMPLEEKCEAGALGRLVSAGFPAGGAGPAVSYDGFVRTQRFKNILRPFCMDLRAAKKPGEARETAYTVGLSPDEYRALLRLRANIEPIRWLVGNTLRVTASLLKAGAEAIWPEGLNKKEP